MIITQLLPLEPESKACFVLAILALSFYLQNTEKPFLIEKINTFENHSILLILATTYLGFMTSLQADSQFNDFFTAMFYIMNSVFYLYWIFEIWLKPCWISKLLSKKNKQMKLHIQGIVPSKSKIKSNQIK